MAETTPTVSLRELRFVPEDAEPGESYRADEIEGGTAFGGAGLSVLLTLDGPAPVGAALVQSAGGREVARLALPEGQAGAALAVTLRRGRNRLGFEGLAGPPVLVTLHHRSALADVAGAFVRALVVLVLAQTFVLQTYRIPSASMEDTLRPGDHVLVEKVTYAWRAPRPGELVVFRSPGEGRVDFVKRLVAGPDSVVAGEGTFVTVDGRRLVEPWAAYREFLPYAGFGRRRVFGPTFVPPGHLFVMGDNRDNSTDSRVFGPVPRGNVGGRPWMVYWPPARAGLIRHGDLEASSP